MTSFDTDRKMASKRLTLRVPEQILNKLKLERQKYAYSSIQEVILEMLRETLFMKSEKVGGTRGRPRKIDEFKILSKKRIFSK